LPVDVRPTLRELAVHAVAAQVAFESKTLKPVFSLLVSTVETGAFKLWVNWIKLVQPHHAGGDAHGVVVGGNLELRELSG
jgi:hypothetical protein